MCSVISRRAEFPTHLLRSDFNFEKSRVSLVPLFPELVTHSLSVADMFIHKIACGALSGQYCTPAEQTFDGVNFEGGGEA